MEELKQPFPPGDVPKELNLVVKIWNICGGQLDFTAIQTLCEIYGIPDRETLIEQLVAIRDSK